MTVTPVTLTLPPGALENLACASYWDAVRLHNDASVSLERKVVLLATALRGLCHAHETADFARRLLDLQSQLQIDRRPPTSA